jgi:hypothetical protein
LTGHPRLQKGFGKRRHAEILHIREVYVPDAVQRLKQDAAPTRAISLNGTAPAFLVVGVVPRGGSAPYSHPVA